MASEQQILKEYLVALGFKIDEHGSRKFDHQLERHSKAGAALGKTLVGVATTAAVMAHQFAKSLERMFYASRYADTTVTNMQALEYGARNVGLEAGAAGAALKNMTASIRANPGLIGLLKSLGVEVKGRDKADVLVDFVTAIKDLPPYISQRYASMFGIDPETLFNLTEGLEKLKAMQAARKAMAEEMGVDLDKSAEVAKEYMTMWREVTERAGLFGMAISELILPQMRELLGETNQLVTGWTKIVNDMRTAQRGSPNDPARRLREGFTGVAEGDRVTLTPEAKARLGLPEKDLPPVAPPGKGAGISKGMKLYQDFLRWRDRKRGQYMHRPATDPDAVDAATDLSDFQSRSGASAGEDPGVDQPGFDPQEYLRRLERQYNLPAGLLDRVWQRESQRGNPKWMRSPAGAMGHFGFMPKTAKEYGLKDPDDFTESADASARKWSDLLKRYKGDTRMAAAAYNWGDGNLARNGLAKAPPETRDYMDAVAGPASVQQNVEINVHGVNNPERAADLVVSKQREVQGDLVRNLSPKIQ